MLAFWIAWDDHSYMENPWAERKIAYTDLALVVAIAQPIVNVTLAIIEHQISTRTTKIVQTIPHGFGESSFDNFVAQSVEDQVLTRRSHRNQPSTYDVGMFGRKLVEQFLEEWQK